jgi:HK97 family phage portal protein
VRFLGFDVTRARGRGLTPTGAPVPVRGSGGWWPIVREPFPGAWQQNQEIAAPSVLAYAAVYACTTLIAQDIGKLPVRLVEQDDAGIWTEIWSPAFSPVLAKPNRYQTINKFLEQWLVSKLTTGNTYVLKQRDERGVVVALYVLDPAQVRPLVTPDGAVYYELTTSPLAGVEDTVTVPAREIIHDLMVPLFHPLVGVTPIYACGMVALQGLKIQENSTNFFANGSSPGGVLLVPGQLNQEQATRMHTEWTEKYTGTNAGKVAILPNGITYQAMTVNAVDAQLIEQLKWTVEQICSCYHVPAALIDSSHQPPYANSEPLVQQYYSQCLQCLIVALELALDHGLGLVDVPGKRYGTECDIDALIWMDTTTKTKAATDAIVGGVLSPNESRAKYFGVGAVPGGDTPYLQQQMYSMAALAERDADQPFSKPASAPQARAPEDEAEDVDLKAFAALLTVKAAQEGWLRDA